MSSPEAFTPPPQAGATGDVMQAYARIWRHVQVAVERHVRELTTDYDEREELMQAARLELWRIEPSRCDVTNREDVLYLRALLKRHIGGVATKKFGGKNARSDSVPLDLVKQLGGGKEGAVDE